MGALKLMFPGGLHVAEIASRESLEETAESWTQIAVAHIQQAERAMQAGESGFWLQHMTGAIEAEAKATAAKIEAETGEPA
jgi:hypothetical protein